MALELDDEVRIRLAEAAAQLRPAFAGVRFVRPAGIHLTLRFLGETNQAQIERIKKALARVAASAPATEAKVAGLGVFPERGSPRVLWVGLEITDSVRALQRACEEAAVEAGFERERRPFRAHLTLGRWRDRARAPTLPAVDLGVVRLRTLTLFRSDLGAGGSVYAALERWTLGEGVAG